jgi:hypothetical protein
MLEQLDAPGSRVDQLRQIQRMYDFLASALPKPLERAMAHRLDDTRYDEDTASWRKVERVRELLGNCLPRGWTGRQGLAMGEGSFPHVPALLGP